MDTIVNRVASSGLVSLDLESFLPKGERVLYDLKDNLFQEMILREKDFREFVKEHDWSQYDGKYVAINCSVEAIIPTWAYMLVASKMSPFSLDIVFGDLNDLNSYLINQAIDKISAEDYKDAKVVVKGCGDLSVSDAVYITLTKKLTPHVASLMYGEPCSTVPIYKKPKR